MADWSDLVDPEQLPRAVHLVVVENFLLLGTPDADTPQRVWWSAIVDEK